MSSPTETSPSVTYLLDTIKALEKRTSCLLEMGRFVREVHDFHELLGRLLAKAAELVGADAGVIALAEEGEFKFVNVHYASLPPQEAGKKEKLLQAVRLKLTEGVIGQVHASGEPRIVSDLGADGAVRKDVADSVSYEVRNLMAVPLSVDGDKLGAVEFLNKKGEGPGGGGPFTPMDLDLASAIAGQIALVVEAHRLREAASKPKAGSEDPRIKALEAEKDESLAAAKKSISEIEALRAERSEARAREKTWAEEKESLAVVAREETARRAAAEQALKDFRETAEGAEEKLSHMTKDLETAFRVQEKSQRRIEELVRAVEEAKNREHRPREHQAAMMKAFSAVSSNQPTDIVLDTLLSTITTLLDAEAASLLLVDEETGRLYFAAATGQKKDPLKKVLLKEGEGIAGWVVKNGRALNIPDVARDPRFSDQADKSSDFKTRSVLAAPLFSDSRLIGVAEAVNKRGEGPFTEDDGQTLIALSLYGAIVIRKAQIYWDMNELFLSTTAALADAMEAKGAGGKGRAERVRRLTLALGAELNAPAANNRDIELAALLHEVGKVIVPESVMAKHEGLSDEEARLVSRAPVVAAEILAPAKPLKNVVPLVRHVHERWDGQGHPDKLKGEAIPLGSRLIAVASAYEVLTADRAYRRRLPEEVAVREIETLRGAQLDPAAVDALVRLYRKGKLKDLFK